MSQGLEEEQEESLRIDTLTRRNAAGEMYRREPVVARQIHDALRLEANRLRERAGVTDETAPDFLKEECLVYLIRHYHRAGERRLVSDLSEVLIRRCAKLINGHLRSLGPESTRDGYNDVVERLFALIVDLVSDRGDFLQVRFWPTLERLAIRVFQEQLQRMRQAQRGVPLPSVAGYDYQEGEGSSPVERPHGDTRAATEPDESRERQRVG